MTAKMKIDTGRTQKRNVLERRERRGLTVVGGNGKLGVTPNGS